MRLKKLLALFMTMAILVCLCACGFDEDDDSSLDDSPAVKGGTIRIGVFEPLSGEDASGGQRELLGIRFANEKFPSVKVGKKTYELQLVEMDNESSVETAYEMAEDLIGQDVSVVIGSYGSSMSMSIRDLFLESKIPLIGCSDSNTFITRENEYCFRVGLVDSLQGTAVANFLKEMKLFSAAVLRENNDDYALGLTDYFREAYTNLVGGTVVYDGFFEPGTTDFTPQLQEIAAAAPDAIFIPSSSAYAAALITQIRQMGISSQIISGDTWENVQTIRTAGADLCEGVVISSFFRNDDRAASGFVRSFRRYLSASAENLAMNGGTEDVSAFSALGYDAYLSVVGAISSIDGKVTGQTIREALNELNMSGVTGQLAFDENGDDLKNTITFKQVKDGQFRYIGTMSSNGTYTPLEKKKAKKSK